MTLSRESLSESRERLGQAWAEPGGQRWDPRQYLMPPVSVYADANLKLPANLNCQIRVILTVQRPWPSLDTVRRSRGPDKGQFRSQAINGLERTRRPHTGRRAR